ncbi:MAG: DoxX family protein [Gammaproteobacteria bacterium]|nr:DoxX family protein [Gammaproteobacteria bacterium]
MSLLLRYAQQANNFLLNIVQQLDFLAPLVLRCYLVPIFWLAGSNKMMHFSDTVAWFGDGGLGLPFPQLLAFLATATEMGGAILLLLGLATRWISIPLMITMLVAMFTVHWQHGWQAVHDGASPFASANLAGAMQRLNYAKETLYQHTDYEWLTETGNFVILNNGIEWAATYFIMLLALFCLGGGRWISADYWLKKYLSPN